MAQHTHRHDDGHDHEPALADLLDLDAEVLGAYLDEVTGWLGRHAPAAPRTIVDAGAGTGTGSLALARRFDTARVVAIDRSTTMLERLRATAREQGVADRIDVVQADLDAPWPEAGTAVDIVWAASSLHEVADPDRVLREAHAALEPGGLLVVVEMDDLPRVLPDDVSGRPGLQARCLAALAAANWNSHPDWRPHLERAGFQIAAQRGFAVESQSPSAGHYAHTLLSRMRPALDGRLDTADLDALDRQLADGSPDAIRHRRDLTVRGSRTAWAARRP